MQKRSFSREEFSSNFRVHLKRPLGKGHDAIVYEVEDRNRRSFALKCLALQSETNALNLTNEINILMHINHSNIVSMIAHCDDFTCLLLELMPHGSLHRLLLQGPMPMAIANGITIQLADALRYIHSMDITHGDIKLDNILISDKYIVKMCDFGFARVKGESVVPKNSICGSIGYTAPEIYFVPQNHKLCDVFSLGVIYFILITGNPPFETNYPGEVDPWWSLIENAKWDTFWEELALPLNQDFKDLIQRVLHANPAQRMQLDELIQRLQVCAADEQQIREEIQKRLK